MTPGRQKWLRRVGIFEGRVARVRGAMDMSSEIPEISPDLGQGGGESLSKRQVICLDLLYVGL